MKFRYSLNVMIDNFAVTYKHLVYKLIITVISFILYGLVISPYIKALTSSPDFSSLLNGVREFLSKLVRGEEGIGSATEQIERAFTALLNMITENRGNIILGIFALICVHFVEKFFTGLGNYAMGAVINDKMSLRANSPYCATLIKNLKEACIYNLIYAPLSIAYDLICYFLLFLIVFKLLALLPFMNIIIQLFLFITAMVFLIALKMTFTSDWLPSLIRGKMNQKQAFLYTFGRKNKKTANVLSNFVIIVLIIFTLNVAGIICTLGCAALITVPASYSILICFEFVNYYDREELKYFIDKNTIIKPEKEHVPTREEFFRGE